MKKRRGGKKRKPVSEHYKNAFRQTYLYEFPTEPSLSEGSTLPQDLVQQLTDIDLRIRRLEGERVFTSGEPSKSISQYIDEHPEMLSVNEEMKRLIAAGKVKTTN